MRNVKVLNRLKLICVLQHIIESTVLLLLVFVFFLGIIAIRKFRLSKTIGGILFGIYIAFVVYNVVVNILLAN